MKNETHASHIKEHTVYKTTDGVRVPSVTTILKVLDKSNYLVPWANKLGMEGIDAMKYRDEKARVGTLAHEMILSHFNKREPNLYDFSQREIDQAENSFLKALEWEKRHTINTILVEAHLVSEVNRFGGTIDLYADIDGKLELIDWKTGNGIYPEFWFQLAGYGLLLDQQGQEVEARRIVNIGRDETENFIEAVRPGPPLDDEIAIFRACQTIYECKKRLRYD